MRLPNAENAVVELGKITEYLLNEEHEDGRGKALFLLSFGFLPQSPERLVDALLGLVRTHEVSSLQPSPHGTKYIVDGRLQAPDGRQPVVRTVWMFDHGRDRG
jgi:hypothetical protein